MTDIKTDHETPGLMTTAVDPRVVDAGTLTAEAAIETRRMTVALKTATRGIETHGDATPESEIRDIAAVQASTPVAPAPPTTAIAEIGTEITGAGTTTGTDATETGGETETEGTDETEIGAAEIPTGTAGRRAHAAATASLRQELPTGVMRRLAKPSPPSRRP